MRLRPARNYGPVSRVSRWIGYYNARRPHSTLAGRTPDETYGAMETERWAAGRQPEPSLSKPPNGPTRRDHLRQMARYGAVSKRAQCVIQRRGAASTVNAEDFGMAHLPPPRVSF